MGGAPVDLSKRTRDISRALLLCLRAGGSKIVRDVRDASGLLRALEGKGIDVAPIRSLRYRLAVTGDLIGTSTWPQTISLIFDVLKPLLKDEIDESEFAAALETDDDASSDSCLLNNSVVVSHSGKTVSVEVGTTASVKGETHLATLVLDGIVHHLKRHDIGAAMESIANGSPMPSGPKSIKGAYRGLYVGMSRPTELLAIATHKDRVTAPQLAALQSNGWRVVNMSG
ncbi:hypothetical protein BN126350104 [Stenotrophomonas thermophila]|nr:hypothetical protein BN126350104 [Stenotrophomonas maltophilia]